MMEQVPSADVAVSLILVAIPLIAWEFIRPGTVIPGLAGATALMIALFSLPWSLQTAMLLLTGIAALWLQTHRKLLWMPGALALISFASLPETFGASPLAVFPIAIETLLLIVLLRIAARARRNKVSVE